MIQQSSSAAVKKIYKVHPVINSTHINIKNACTVRAVHDVSLEQQHLSKNFHITLEVKGWSDFLCQNCGCFILYIVIKCNVYSSSKELAMDLCLYYTIPSQTHSGPS